jgi:hypothetical protein
LVGLEFVYADDDPLEDGLVHQAAQFGVAVAVGAVGFVDDC